MNLHFWLFIFHLSFLTTFQRTWNANIYQLHLYSVCIRRFIISFMHARLGGEKRILHSKRFTFTWKEMWHVICLVVRWTDSEESSHILMSDVHHECHTRWVIQNGCFRCHFWNRNVACRWLAMTSRGVRRLLLVMVLEPLCRTNGKDTMLYKNVRVYVL